MIRALVIGAGVTGCSLGIAPVRHGERPPQCESSNVLPVIDLAVGVISAVAAQAMFHDVECHEKGCEILAVPAVAPLLYVLSGLGGLRKTRACRQVKRAYAAEVAATEAEAETRALGGQVRGLRGVLVLQERDERVEVHADGWFWFGDRPVGSYFEIVVAAQPAGQACVVEHGRGLLGDYAVVTVTCADLAE